MKNIIITQRQQGIAVKIEKAILAWEKAVPNPDCTDLPKGILEMMEDYRDAGIRCDVCGKPHDGQLYRGSVLCSKCFHWATED